MGINENIINIEEEVKYENEHGSKAGLEPSHKTILRKELPPEISGIEESNNPLRLNHILISRINFSISYPPW